MPRTRIYFCCLATLLVLGSARAASGGPPEVAVEAGRVDFDRDTTAAIGMALVVKLDKAGVRAMDEEELRMRQDHERLRGNKGSKAARDFQSAPIKLRWGFKKLPNGNKGFFSVQALDSSSGQPLFVEKVEVRGKYPQMELVSKIIPQIAERVATKLKKVDLSAAPAQGPTSPLPKLPPAKLDTKVICGAARLAPLEELGRYYLEAVNIMDRNRDAPCAQIVEAVRAYRQKNHQAIEKLRQALPDAMEPFKPFQACRDQIRGRAAGATLAIITRCKQQRHDIAMTVGGILVMQVYDKINR